MATAMRKGHLYTEGANVEFGVIWAKIHAVVDSVAKIGDPTKMCGLNPESKAICGKRVRVYSKEYMMARKTRVSDICEKCIEIAPNAMAAINAGRR